MSAESNNIKIYVEIGDNLKQVIQDLIENNNAESVPEIIETIMDASARMSQKENA